MGLRRNPSYYFLYADAEHAKTCRMFPRMERSSNPDQSRPIRGNNLREHQNRIWHRHVPPYIRNSKTLSLSCVRDAIKTSDYRKIVILILQTHLLLLVLGD